MPTNACAPVRRRCLCAALIPALNRPLTYYFRPARSWASSAFSLWLAPSESIVASASLSAWTSLSAPSTPLTAVITWSTAAEVNAPVSVVGRTSHKWPVTLVRTPSGPSYPAP